MCVWIMWIWRHSVYGGGGRIGGGGGLARNATTTRGSLQLLLVGHSVETIAGCCGPGSDFIFNDPSGKSISKLMVFDIFSSQFEAIVDI